MLHNSSRGVDEGVRQPTARGGVRPQVKDQGPAYQSEPETRRDDRNQHGGRKARKNTE
jgi:hypothetical protein